MKKIIALLCFGFLLVSCSPQKQSDALQAEYDNVRDNLILTKIPICRDNEFLYYAENGKILKKKDGRGLTSVIDSCAENELIQDVYVDNQCIYYAKQNDEQTLLIGVDKNNTDNIQKQYTVKHKAYSFGEDFICTNEHGIYYYSDANNVLYLFDDNDIYSQENITCAFVGKEYVYYADTAGKIHKSDLNLKNSQEIWLLDAVRESDDEFLINWCNSNLNEYSVIKNIALREDRVIFTVCSNENIKNGLFCSIKSDGNDFWFEKNCAVDYYQFYGDSIYIKGLYSDGQNVTEGIFCYSSDSQIVPINSNKEMYIYDNYCYFEDNESGDRILTGMDLTSQEIEVIK